MLSRRARLSSAIALLLVTTALSLPSARGDTYARSDPNDVAPLAGLDLLSVGHSHSGERVTHDIRFQSPVSEGSFHRGRYFALVLDTDLDLRDAERYVFVFSRGTQIAGVMTFGNGNEHYDAQVKVTHPSPRVYRVGFDPKFLGKLKGGYRWFAFSHTPEAEDAAPNRKWLVHDIVAPQIELLPPADEVPGTADLNIHFNISDPDGRGMGDWVVRKRAWSGWDDSPWTDVASGTGGGLKDAVVPIDANDDIQFCVRATDVADNSTSTTYNRVWTYRDDADAALAYSGTWSTTPLPGSYMGTLHTTSEVGAKVTLPAVDGIYEGGWILSTSDGSSAKVKLLINGSSAGSIWVQGPGVQLESSTWLSSYSYSNAGSPPYSIEMVLEEGTLGFDGILFPMPEYESPPLVGWEPVCGEALPAIAEPVGVRGRLGAAGTEMLPRERFELVGLP